MKGDSGRTRPATPGAGSVPGTGALVPQARQGGAESAAFRVRVSPATA